MKTFRIVMFFALFALLAFGQEAKVKRMDGNTAAQAWASINQSVESSGGPLDGGLIKETEANGFDQKVWFLFSRPGAYLMQGKTCDGRMKELGEFYTDLESPTRGLVMVFETNSVNRGMPFFPNICGLTVMRSGVSPAEQYTTDINPWAPQEEGLKIGSEGVVDGRYYVMTAPLPPNTTAIIGRESVGEVRTTPFGSMVLLPASTYLPWPGSTTLTVCTAGKCKSTVYDRKVTVQPATPPGSNQKG